MVWVDAMLRLETCRPVEKTLDIGGKLAGFGLSLVPITPNGFLVIVRLLVTELPFVFLAHKLINMFGRKTLKILTFFKGNRDIFDQLQIKFSIKNKCLMHFDLFEYMFFVLVKRLHSFFSSKCLFLNKKI